MDVDPRKVVSTWLDPDAARAAMAVERRRPGMVTALGWIWIGLSLFIAAPTAMTGLMMLATDGEVPRLPVAGTPGGASELGPITWLFDHFGTVLLLQLAVAFLILVAAIGLFRLKAWARTTLEALSWVGLALLLAWNAWFLRFWLAMTADLPELASGDLPATLVRAFGVMATLLGVVFYCAILGTLLWMLRHRTVREAVAPVEESP
ncbi:MAG: hypothetical protein R3325_16765 [Thermoanaerobaculia bacterium]|nr:hypothetical protein [Thermoanaerobaculia bacterium]